MAQTLDTLHVDLSLRNHQQVISGLASVKSAIAGVKATTAGGLAVNAIGAFARSNFSEVKALFGAGGITSLVAAGTVKAAADMEQARLGLKRFVDTDFGHLSSGIEQLSLKIPIATAGLYDIASGAAQVGVEGTANILAFTEVVGKLATVSSMSFNDTAKDLAKLHNVFNLKPDQAPRTANVIAGLAAASAADPGELITTTRMLSGATATIKFTLDQTIALAAAIKDAGISSEVGATAFNKLILDMGKSPAEFARITDMTTGDFKKLRDSNPMQALLKALKSIESESNIDDKIAKSEAIGVESVRQSGAVLQMIKAIESLTQHLDRAQKFGDEKTVLNKQFDTQAASTYASLQKLGNAFLLIADQMGGPVARALAKLADMATNQVGVVKGQQVNVAKDYDERFEKMVKDISGMAPADRAAVLAGIPEQPRKAAEDRLKEIEAGPKREAAAAAEIKASEDNVAVLQETVARRKKHLDAMDIAIRGLLESTDRAIKMAKAAKNWGDGDTKDLDKAVDETLTMVADKQKLRTVLVGLIAKTQAALDEADTAKVITGENTPRKEDAAGFKIQEGGRKFAFDQMLDPQGFAQMKAAFHTLPKDMLDSDAGKEMAKKLAAVGGADVKKNLNEEELNQLLSKRAGIIGGLVSGVTQERVQRLYARPTFSSGEETWKRIAAGAAEGSGLERAIKDLARTQSETKKVQEELNGMFRDFKATWDGNAIVIRGEP